MTLEAPMVLGRELPVPFIPQARALQRGRPARNSRCSVLPRRPWPAPPGPTRAGHSDDSQRWLGVGTRRRGGLAKWNFPEGCGSRELGQAEGEEVHVARGAVQGQDPGCKGTELQAPSPLLGRHSLCGTPGFAGCPAVRPSGCPHSSPSCSGEGRPSALRTSPLPAPSTC